MFASKYHEVYFLRKLMSFNNENTLCSNNIRACLGLGMHTNCMSKLFQPQIIIPKNAEVKHDDVTSKSQKLMVEMGIVRPTNSGFFSLLPLGQRSLEKLIAIVDQEMHYIGAQKLLLPLLTSAELWKITGRWLSAHSELFTLKDRHEKEFVLSPTHEESITELIASVPQLSYRQLPLRLYQVNSKFRDEMKPRFGLLRGREFLMKDLYSFDVSVEAAKETYQDVKNSYENIFKTIGVKYVAVLGNSGMMGGSLSHEYHFPSAVGEDHLLTCEACNYGANREVFEGNTCPVCKQETIKQSLGIEVGHLFFLGTKYSSPLKATFLKPDGKPDLVQMGSYGLGMSRILAAAVEVLSLPDEIRWPLKLAPFTICIIPPKKGSKEDTVSSLVKELYISLNSVAKFKNDVIIDDRCQLTIGKRIYDAKRTGYPFIVIVGKKASQPVPHFEVLDLIANEQIELTDNGVLNYLEERCMNSQAS